VNVGHRVATFSNIGYEKKTFLPNSLFKVRPRSIQEMERFLNIIRVIIFFILAHVI